MQSKIKETLSVLSNIPSFFRLTWQASPCYTVILCLITLSRGILPVAKLWVGKLIVDAVVSAASSKMPLEHLGNILWLVALEIALVLADSLLEKLYSFIGDIMRDILTLHINTSLLRKSVELDIAYYESPSFHDQFSMAQRSDGSQVILVVEHAFNMIQCGISISTILLLLTRLSWILMIVALFSVIPNLLQNLKYSGAKYHQRKYLTPEARKANYLRGLLTRADCAKEVKLFDIGNYLISQWRSIYKRFFKENRTISLKNNIGRFLVDICSNLGFYGCYIYILYQTVIGAITLGDMTMYSSAIARSQGLWKGILYGISIIYENSLNISNFFAFLGLKPFVAAKPFPEAFPSFIAKGIEFRDVSFSYPGSNHVVLQDINFTVKAGETVALVGENGAGKTTLVKLLARLYDATEGSITIDGTDIREFDPSELHKHIGIIFQDFTRYCFPVIENIGLAKLEQLYNRAQIMEAAKKSDAHDFILRLPHQYETMLGKEFGGVELSLGEWQKIALARAFVRDAQILILDEPTASLDAVAEYEIFKRFFELTLGKTTILISHRFSTVRMADRILVIEQGRIVEQGSHEELMKLNGKYAYMFNLQAESYRTK